jgi:hypothetical protein
MSNAELELFPADKPIEVYNEFRAQMAELKAFNDSAVFDYADAKGNKEARSHVFKLRKTKTAIEATRKDAKAAALAFGKRLDAEAADITKQVEEMIDVHQRPLDEIEEREAQRLGAIKERIEAIEALGTGLESLSAAQLAPRLASIEAIVVDDSFAEFLGDAAKAHDLSLLRLRAALPAAEKREAEAKELEELRKLKIERDAQLAKEAAEQAAKAKAENEANARAAAEKQKAEDDAKAAAFAQMKAEERAKEAEEREAQAKIDNAKRIEEMAAKAKKDAEDAAAAAKAKAEAEQAAKDKAEADEQAKREANKKHVAKIQMDICADLSKELGINAQDALALCEMVSQGKIRHLSIKY